MEKIATQEILPYLGKQYRGVFLGDEICCSNVTCWDTALAPVAAKFRTLLGPDAIIYTNECANKGIQNVPEAFDLISVDTYAGYTPGSHGGDEADRNTHPHPHPHPHPEHTQR